MKIHASGEDYLEAVLVLQKNHGAVRSIDVARRVGVSKASVSYAVSALREGGFLTVDSDYVLHLTETGRNVVVKLFIRIANRVALLYNWFNKHTHKIGEAVRLKILKMRYCRPLGGIA